MKTPTISVIISGLFVCLCPPVEAQDAPGPDEPRLAPRVNKATSPPAATRTPTEQAAAPSSRPSRSVFYQLCDKLKSGDEEQRRVAAFRLGLFKNRQAFPLLYKALQKDPSPAVRGSAAYSLGMLGDQRAVPGLAYAVGNDSSEWVRSAAKSALRDLGHGLRPRAAKRGAYLPSVDLNDNYRKAREKLRGGITTAAVIGGLGVLATSIGVGIIGDCANDYCSGTTIDAGIVLSAIGVGLLVVGLGVGVPMWVSGHNQMTYQEGM